MGNVENQFLADSSLVPLGIPSGDLSPWLHSPFLAAEVIHGVLPMFQGIGDVVGCFSGHSSHLSAGGGQGHPQGGSSQKS